MARPKIKTAEQLADFIAGHSPTKVLATRFYDPRVDNDHLDTARKAIQFDAEDDEEVDFELADTRTPAYIAKVIATQAETRRFK
jgi:hypothetical protein